MRYPFLLLLTVLLQVTSHAQVMHSYDPRIASTSVDDDYWMGELKGSVKKITWIDSLSNEDNGIEKVFTFDSFKTVSMLTTINPDDTLNPGLKLMLSYKHICEYTYGENGKMVEKDENQGFGAALHTSKTSYKYDDKGDLTEVTVRRATDPEGKTYKNLRTYNDHHKMTGEVQFFVLDSGVDGNSAARIDSINRYTYKYDDKGNEIERIIYFLDTTDDKKIASETYLYKYDDRNNEIQQQFYILPLHGKKRYVGSTKYTYSHANMLVDEYSDYDVLFFWEQREPHGNAEYIYEYDGHGNWITRRFKAQTRYMDNDTVKPFAIMEQRTIEYR